MAEAKRFCGICVCVLQPVSVVAPTAVTEAGAQPPKDGEKHLLPLRLPLPNFPIFDVKGYYFKDTFLSSCT